MKRERSVRNSELDKFPLEACRASIAWIKSLPGPMSEETASGLEAMEISLENHLKGIPTPENTETRLLVTLSYEMGLASPVPSHHELKKELWKAVKASQGLSVGATDNSPTDNSRVLTVFDKVGNLDHLVEVKTIIEEYIRNGGFQMEGERLLGYKVEIVSKGLDA